MTDPVVKNDKTAAGKTDGHDAARRAAVQRLVGLAAAAPMVTMLVNPRSAKAQANDTGFIPD
ncbi:hypothetical protein [Marinivivus vitaminiproducens]|uniref:hypothetical protein n=1 Tax=Marinivivus vitaminiproducens TaxID=3035935 RepID=UPI00279A7E54|nr:hypothetical protein P4R82_17615 [Geminicoccaceae bacterium SCSIO 64248]